MTLRNPGRHSLRAAGPIGVVIAAGALYYHWLNIPPPMPAPKPAPPSPNGFDALAAAASLQVKSDEVRNALYNSLENREHIYTLHEKEVLVALNAAALVATRRALSIPHCVPLTGAPEDSMPEFHRFRALAMLLILDSQVRNAHGNVAGAVNCDLDAIQPGIIVPHGGALWAALTGNVCESMGDRPIWQCVNLLDAESAASTTRRLETITDGRFPFCETLQNEKRAGQLFLADAFQRKSTGALDEQMNGAVSFQPANSESEDETATEAAAQFKLAISNRIDGYKLSLTHSKRRIYEDYSAAMDANMAGTRFPYVFGGLQNDGIDTDKNAPSDPISQRLYASVPSSRRYPVESQLQTGLLLCTLALRAYRLRSGHYPGSLTNLVSAGVLHRLPDDPLARSLNTPFGYRKTATDSYVLYSVGPDGIDDGGRPVDLSHTARPNRYLPEFGDKGDWVAGINIGKPVNLAL